ncbi:S-layer homology domain-containing protein [Paenibacillus sp. GCM10027626]
MKVSAEQIVQARLMNGVTSKRFAPNEHATRAEAAVIKRLLPQHLSN